jgi:hypothetical protein
MFWPNDIVVIWISSLPHSLPNWSIDQYVIITRIISLYTYFYHSWDIIMYLQLSPSDRAYIQSINVFNEVNGAQRKREGRGSGFVVTALLLTRGIEQSIIIIWVNSSSRCFNHFWDIITYLQLSPSNQACIQLVNAFNEVNDGRSKWEGRGSGFVVNALLLTGGIEQSIIITWVNSSSTYFDHVCDIIIHLHLCHSNRTYFHSINAFNKLNGVLTNRGRDLVFAVVAPMFTGYIEQFIMVYKNWIIYVFWPHMKH